MASNKGNVIFATSWSENGEHREKCQIHISLSEDKDDASSSSITAAIVDDNNKQHDGDTISPYNKFYCCLCWRLFPTELDVTLHNIQYKHTIIPNEDYNPLKHKQEFSIRVVYKCITCGEKNGHRAILLHNCYLREREKYLEKVKNFNKSLTPLVCLVCPTSERVFESQFHLAAHITVVHGRKALPHQCPICGVKFYFRGRASGMSLHILERHAFDVHVPEIIMKFMKALFSPQGFRIKARINSYICLLPSIKINHDDKNGPSWSIKKPMCDEEFKSLPIQQAHFLCCHLCTPTVQIGANVNFVCHYCNMGFYDDQELEKHTMNKHYKILKSKLQEVLRKGPLGKISLSITCLICWIVFPSPAELQAHIIVLHHSNNINSCGVCNFEYWADKHLNASPQFLWRMMSNHAKQHGLQIINNLPKNNPYKTSLLPHEKTSPPPKISASPKYLTSPILNTPISPASSGFESDKKGKNCSIKLPNSILSPSLINWLLKCRNITESNYEENEKYNKAQ